MSTFGTRLKNLRRERDLTQENIAGYLGVSRSTILGYEVEAKEPRYDMLCRIANYFGVSTDYLLGRSNERRKPPAKRKPGSRVEIYSVRISCLRYGSVRVGASSLEEAMERAEEAYKRGGVTWFDSEITDMTAEEDGERTYTVTEFCPHFESEVEMHWNTDTQGFKAFCPFCGHRLMLCDECHQFGGPCDYDIETDSCRRNLPGEGADNGNLR